MNLDGVHLALNGCVTLKLVAFLQGFGAYLPSRIVDNSEMGSRVGCDSEWIVNVSGIEARRFASEEETVAELAAKAAEDCLAHCECQASQVGLILVSSGSSERRFPGPAAQLASRLGLNETPAIDIPLASAGSLFALSLASRLAPQYGRILVVAAEKMSAVLDAGPIERGTAILFGDGAGACLVSAESGAARIIDSELHTDGAFRDDLKLEFGAGIEMNGRSVIMQASRKIPRVIDSILSRNGRKAGEVSAFLMHQANQNLIVRVAQALGVPPDKFYSNIRAYGNTSSASMLIAASEWSQSAGFRPGEPVCFAAFGAGFHWGALLAEGV